MGRFYSVPIDAVAATAAQDLWEVVAATGKPFWLHGFSIGQSTDYGDAAAEGARIRIKRGISNTSGSGGSTVTPAKHLTNDAAAGPTAEINNTTQAVAGGGSITVLWADALNIQVGYQYWPVPEQRYFFLAGEACIVDLPAAPADSITLSGVLVFEEM